MLNKENIIFKTVKAFPDFKNSKEFDLWKDDISEPFMFFMGFTNYLHRLVSESNQPVKDVRITRIFKFIDGMALSQSKYVRSIAISLILESIANQEATLLVGRDLLSRHTLQFIDDYLDEDNSIIKNKK